MTFPIGTNGCGCTKNMFAVIFIAVCCNLLFVESTHRDLKNAYEQRQGPVPVPAHSLRGSNELNNGKPRVFVCITGQLVRLELENKFQQLIMPLIEAGFQTDVGLALSAGDAHFSNSNNIERTAFPSMESVLDFVSQYPASTKVNVYDVMSDPKPSDAYIEAIHMKWRHTPEEHLERLQNHVRMVDAYQRCWKIARSYGGSAGGSVYDAFIRVREDVGFETPFDTKLVRTIAHAKQKVVAVPPCRMWFGGVNDRMAVVSAKAGKPYFLLPAEIMVDDPHKKLGRHSVSINYDFVTNTESFLRSLYTACDMKILASPKFPLVHRITTIETPRGTLQEMFVETDVNEPRCLSSDELDFFFSVERSELVNITRGDF